MSRVILNGKEISAEEAKEKLGTDPLLGLLNQSSYEDPVQTLILEENKKLDFNNALIVVYDPEEMSFLDKLVLKFTIYFFNRKTPNN